MLSGNRARSAWCAACVAALVALVLAAAGVAATPASKLSPKLVGSWSRTLTRSDVAKGKPLLPAAVMIGTTCTFSVKPTGAVTLDCGRIVGHFNGELVPLSATNVRIELGDGVPNSYRWSVGGGHLTLASVSDTSHTRVTIFRGMWKRG